MKTINDDNFTLSTCTLMHSSVVKSFFFTGGTNRKWDGYLSSSDSLIVEILSRLKSKLLTVMFSNSVLLYEINWLLPLFKR